MERIHRNHVYNPIALYIGWKKENMRILKTSLASSPS